MVIGDGSALCRTVTKPLSLSLMIFLKSNWINKRKLPELKCFVSRITKLCTIKSIAKQQFKNFSRVHKSASNGN